MVGWHHQLNGHEFEQDLGVDDGQGGLACCSPWRHKELDMTERLNWTDTEVLPNLLILVYYVSDCKSPSPLNYQSQLILPSNIFISFTSLSAATALIQNLIFFWISSSNHGKVFLTCLSSCRWVSFQPGLCPANSVVCKKNSSTSSLTLILNVSTKILKLFYKAHPQTRPSSLPAFLFCSFGVPAISHFVPTMLHHGSAACLLSVFSSLSSMLDWQKPIYPWSFRLFWSLSCRPRCLLLCPPITPVSLLRACVLLYWSC